MLGPFPGKTKSDHEETATATAPSLAGLWSEHASTTNQSTPERTPPPQAHTPQRRMMDLPEAHAAEGDRARVAQVIPQPACSDYLPICNHSSK